MSVYPNLYAAKRDGSESVENLSQFKELRNVACGILAVWAVTAASPVIAANQVKTQDPFSSLNVCVCVCFPEFCLQTMKIYDLVQFP